MDSIDKIYGYRSYDTHKALKQKADVLKVYSQLCKVRISTFAALSALTGGIMVSGDITSAMLITMAGVFFLACGAGSLNQYQEKDIDAMMTRTQSRPIPAGDIQAPHAIHVTAVLCIAGFSTLAVMENVLLMGLGLFALVWYNLVYTNLKQVTAFAAVPGAIIGAIPPAMGWVAGGGSLYDHALLPICLFFFMWQVPHFWFLLFSHEEDYKKSDLPALVKIFNKDQFGRVAIIWTMATAVALFLIPLFGIMLSDIALLLLGIASVWLVWCGSSLVHRTNEGDACHAAFKSMNMYMLFVMAVLNIERLINL